MARGQSGRLQSRRFAAADALPPVASDRRARQATAPACTPRSSDPRTAIPIVLAHGITCAIRVWAYQIADLAQRPPGHRLRPPRPRPQRPCPPRRSGYGLNFLAADLDAVLEATLKPGERAVIAGHSMGGIAITLVVRALSPTGCLSAPTPSR